MSHIFCSNFLAIKRDSSWIVAGGVISLQERKEALMCLLWITWASRLCACLSVLYFHSAFLCLSLSLLCVNGMFGGCPFSVCVVCPLSRSPWWRTGHVAQALSVSTTWKLCCTMASLIMSFIFVYNPEPVILILHNIHLLCYSALYTQHLLHEVFSN